MSDLPDVQPYLKSICDRYQQWWQLYTLTDASGKRQPTNKLQSPFDFGLIVQTVKKESREPEKEEKVERFPVLKGVRKYAKNHVLLVGRPGSGKSTALARLLLDEATQQTSIPVLVELRYWQGSIVDLICEAFARHELQLTAQELEPVLSRLAQGATPKEMLFLFDGVNELPSEEARSQLSAFRRNHPKLPMIFTTRDLSLGGDLGIEKKLEMQPLTEVQMQAFIRSYVPGQAEQMLRQLKDRLREFGQTPLLLWMLCEVIRQSPDSTLPTNLGGVFKVFTEAYEQSSVRKHEVAALKGDTKSLSDRRLWKKALKALAFLMMQGETPVDFRVVIDRNEAERELSRVFPKEQFPGRDILDDLLKYHLLQNRSVDQIEFRHQLIQEYYAAEALLEQLSKLDNEQLKREFLNYLKWTEPIALTLALVDETQTVRVVKLALEVDLSLGARLAGETNPIFHKQTIKLIKNLRLPKNIKIKLLGITCSDEIVDLLRKKLTDEDAGIRWIVVDALGNVKSETAVLLLQKALKDADPQICFKAVVELGGSNSEISVIALTEVFQDEESFYYESPHVPWAAIRSLEKIGNESAVTSLFEALEDKYPSRIRSRALLGLRRLGIEISVDEILRLLEDFDAAVRLNTAYEIQCMNNLSEILAAAQKRGVDLFPVLTLNQYDSLVSDEVSSLVNQFRHTDITPLISYLNHENWEVCCRVAAALGELKDESAVSALKEVLHDEDRYVTWSEAATALAKIGTQSAVLALVDCLETENNELRKYLIDALGETRRHELAEALSLIFQGDEDKDVRCSAAIALGKIGGALAVKALTKQAVFDESTIVEEVAAKELGKIAGYESISPIWELMHLSQNTTFFETINLIQARCRFYNYEIYQDYLEAQKPDRQTHPNSETAETIIMNQPIFNQQHATIGVNYAAEGSNQEVTQYNYTPEPRTEADQQLAHLLTTLRTKYPTKTDAEILEILINGFATMPQNNPQNWQRWKDTFSIIFAGGVEATKILVPVAGIPIEVLKRLYEIYDRNRKQLPGA